MLRYKLTDTCSIYSFVALLCYVYDKKKLRTFDDYKKECVSYINMFFISLFLLSFFFINIEYKNKLNYHNNSSFLFRIK